MAAHIFNNKTACSPGDSCASSYKIYSDCVPRLNTQYRVHTGQVLRVDQLERVIFLGNTNTLIG